MLTLIIIAGTVASVFTVITAFLIMTFFMDWITNQKLDLTFKAIVCCGTVAIASSVVLLIFILIHSAT